MSPHSTAPRRSSRLLAAAILAAAAALIPVAPPAHAGPSAPTVPDKIQVGEGHKVFLVGHAVGVQIYACNAVAGGYAWSFVAPRADLTDNNGKRIVTHFAGPSWRANDGSSVKGSRVDGVPVEGTIPWLLLSTNTPIHGHDGDRLYETTFIQRVATTGGVQPADAACNAMTAGTRSEVDYTADYYFWKAR